MYKSFVKAGSVLFPMQSKFWFVSLGYLMIYNAVKGWINDFIQVPGYHKLNYVYEYSR